MMDEPPVLCSELRESDGVFHEADEIPDEIGMVDLYPTIAQVEIQWRPLPQGL
jgi:hypothetical protein